MAEHDSRGSEQPYIGPQTAQINLNLHNPVQSNLYGSDDSKRKVQDLEALLLRAPRTMTRREAAQAANLSVVSARRIWRALGFPHLDNNQVYYTDEDVKALRLVADLVQTDQVSEETALSLARSIAQLSDRMIAWQIEALVEDMVERCGLTDSQARAELLNVLPELLTPLKDLLDYSWSRQLAAGVQRLAMRGDKASSSDGESGQDPQNSLPLARGVGFADLVSYTSMSRQMNGPTLARLVQHFEQRCAEVVSMGGGRVIKTIGDEIMFLAETPESGARISLALSHLIQEDPDLPQARVAFVWGRVLPRLGDLYGPTVNLASRLVSLTEPGGVVVDASTAAVLGDNEQFVLTPMPTRSVRGFGDIQPVALSQGEGPLLEVESE